MTKEEFVNKYVSEHYPNLHVDLQNLMGGSDVKSLYDNLHAKLISLAGSNVSVDYPILHQYLNDLIYGFKPLDANGHDYVDMGEAGIWATCNVGATSPEQSGLYFQWGDTQGYTAEQVRNGEKTFYLSDYKFSSDSASLENPQFTKYCNDAQYGKDGFTDTLTVLQPEDDAAHVHMGGDWRMPTSDEFVKLYDLCNNSWVNDYEGTGVSGVLFTLKTDSSKQLFFRAAGYVSGEVSFDRYRTYVWSSSLYTNNSFTSLGLLGTDTDGVGPSGCINRYWGLSVRGILGVGE